MHDVSHFTITWEFSSSFLLTKVAAFVFATTVQIYSTIIKTKQITSLEHLTKMLIDEDE